MQFSRKHHHGHHDHHSAGCSEAPDLHTILLIAKIISMSQVVCIRQQKEDSDADYRGRQGQFSEFIVKSEYTKAHRHEWQVQTAIVLNPQSCRDEKSPDRQASRCGYGPGNRKQKLESTDKSNSNNLTRKHSL